MRTHYTLGLLLLLSIISCKKEPQVEQEPAKDLSTISHQLINRRLKASDKDPMNLDVNKDGITDFSYFMEYVMLSGTVYLYTGVNPVAGAATSASEHNDDEFLNMGNTHHLPPSMLVKKDLMWMEDHALLTKRSETNNGAKFYFGEWGDGLEKIMPIRLSLKGKMHYGWVKLKFEKATEELTLIEAAWNTTPEQEMKAGAK